MTLYVNEMKDIPKQLDCEKKHEIIHVKDLEISEALSKHYKRTEIISICGIEYKVTETKYVEWRLLDYNRCDEIEIKFANKKLITAYLQYLRTTVDGEIELTDRQRRALILRKKWDYEEKRRHSGFIGYFRCKWENRH